MKASDLINFLAKYPPDTEVLVCYDSYMTSDIDLEFKEDFLANRLCTHDMPCYESDVLLHNVLVHFAE